MTTNPTSTTTTATTTTATAGGPPKTVWPGLTYRDAPAAIAFLTEAFGFAATLVVRGSDHGDARREVAHAELRWPEGGGVMLGSSVEDGDVFARRPIGTAAVYVVTDSPDELLSRCRAAGAEIVRDIRDEDYGSRGFSARDPEGNLWSFGTYRGV